MKNFSAFLGLCCFFFAAAVADSSTTFAFAFVSAGAILTLPAACRS